MEVEVLVPFRPDRRDRLETRLKAWKYIRNWWRENFPEFKVTPCDDRVNPFSRGCSLNLGASRSNADVLIMANSDVFTDPCQIAEAVRVAYENPRIVFAFDEYMLLDEWHTNALYAGEIDAAGVNEKATSAPWLCISALFAIRRDVFHTVRFDARFRGWGWEDNAFLDAMDTLHGMSLRVRGRVFHLYHERDHNRPEYNKTLYRPYQLARGNVERMRSILAAR